MNREILFRGKRIDNGEWVYGLIWKKKYNTDRICISYFPNEDDEEAVVRVIPETICQYTGLTDKNGRKIFEWDIVKNEYGYIGIAKWEFCSFVIYWLSWSASRDLYVWSNTVEVIGNIFDNPDLLKE